MSSTNARFFPKESYREAAAYAKVKAIEMKRVITCRPIQNGWKVDDEGLNRPPLPTSKDAGAYKLKLSEIQIILTTSLNYIEISTAIKNFQTDFGDADQIIQPTIGAEHQSLVKNLPNLSFSLLEFSDFLDSQADVKLRPQYREDAQEYAAFLADLVNVLNHYPVSSRVDTEKRRMLELAKVLPPKGPAQANQLWLQKVARLNGAFIAPDCSYCPPGTKMHIVGNPGSERWRCNENNHGTRFLSRSHKEILN